MANYRSPYMMDEKKKILHYIIENNAYDRVKGVAMWKEMANDMKIGRTAESMKEHFRKFLIHELEQFKSEFELRDEEILLLRRGNRVKAEKRQTETKHPYTIEEKKKILRYIIDENFYYKIKDLLMWEEMVEDLRLNRTGKSIKEHFRKHLIPKLNKFQGEFELTDDEIRKLKLVYATSARELRVNMWKYRLNNF